MSRDELQFYNNCTFSIFAIFSIPGVDPPCSLLALKYLVKPQQVLGDQQPRGENKNQFPVLVFANYNGKHLNMKRHILSLIYSVILLESRAVSQGRLAIQTCDIVTM